MVPFSWLFFCNKQRWLKEIKGSIAVNNGTVYVRRIWFVDILIFIESKRTRVVWAREDIIREIPITILLGKTLSYKNSIQFKGVSLFQPHQLLGWSLLIFILCLPTDGLIFAISSSLVFLVLFLFGVSGGDISSLNRVKRVLENQLLEKRQNE